MKTFRITISIDEDTTTEKIAQADGLGDLFSRGLMVLPNIPQLPLRKLVKAVVIV